MTQCVLFKCYLNEVQGVKELNVIIIAIITIILSCHNTITVITDVSKISKSNSVSHWI